MCLYERDRECQPTVHTAAGSRGADDVVVSFIFFCSLRARLHWLASRCLGVLALKQARYTPARAPFHYRGPSEPEPRVSGGVASRKAPIGSRVRDSPRRACSRNTSWFVWKDGKRYFRRGKTPVQICFVSLHSTSILNQQKSVRNWQRARQMLATLSTDTSGHRSSASAATARTADQKGKVHPRDSKQV